MTGSQPPLNPNRDPGDAWVQSATGQKYWGRYGAAGLLAVDPDRGVLMQHRALWSHHGGTWGLPGGALHRGESAIVGALREAGEEACVPGDRVRPVVTTVLDKQVWTYTTVIAQVTEPFTPRAGDAESLELAWVRLGDVTTLDLHPAFAASWPELTRLLALRPVVVIDAANVVGSVPDGWWRDRAGAAARLLGRLAALSTRGIAADELGLPGTWWFPELHVVLEGDARYASSGVADGSVAITSADGAGDDAIVEVATRYGASGRSTIVVTSDRGLAQRVSAGGAATRGCGWLLRLLDHPT